MSIKIFLRFTACLTVLIGLGLITAPGAIGKIFLTSYASGSDIFVRFLGSALIGYSCLNWHSSKHTDPAQIQATLVGNFSTLMIASLISIIGMLDHSLKYTGLLVVLLHLSMAAGFAFCLYALRKNKSS